MADDENYLERIRSSFAKQGLMNTLKLIALLTATMMTIDGREGVVD